jgi:hypothetical protein
VDRSLSALSFHALVHRVVGRVAAGPVHIPVASREVAVSLVSEGEGIVMPGYASGVLWAVVAVLCLGALAAITGDARIPLAAHAASPPSAY